MPIKPCSADGKPGFKWGDQGTCYTYTEGNEAEKVRAKAKAAQQAAAAFASGYKE